jgi:hypothetical protein
LICTVLYFSLIRLMCVWSHLTTYFYLNY